jgi:hypothetical protein
MKSFQSLLEDNYETQCVQQFVTRVLESIDDYIMTLYENLGVEEKQFKSYSTIIREENLKEIFDTHNTNGLRLILKEMMSIHLSQYLKQSSSVIVEFLKTVKIYLDAYIILTKPLFDEIKILLEAKVPKNGVNLQLLLDGINLQLDRISLSESELTKILRDCNYQEEIDMMFDLIVKPPPTK